MPHLSQPATLAEWPHFDSLGPAFRAPDVPAALESVAADSELERGAVFTRPEVATAILDLCGYSVDRALHRLCLLEPSFGGGDFLLLAVTRLLQSWRRKGGTPASALADLREAVRAVELHRESVDCALRRQHGRTFVEGHGTGLGSTRCSRRAGLGL